MFAKKYIKLKRFADMIFPLLLVILLHVVRHTLEY
uniref:Uncharacterized protein n=1 Tax=Podoviridae sp. ct8Lf7 TaxID=2827723 RepID=A0A8S5S115_9CAUD|nr:MAG TPA: hypothetical protein [Podoviridae sp. ct8Lf7]